MSDSKTTAVGWFDRERVVKAKALLVGVYVGAKERETAIEHLHELQQLAETYGIHSTEQIALGVRTFSAATYISKGKLQDIAVAISCFEATVVIFDDEISPAQQRNLEAIFRVPVIDRTEIILGVFADHARTKEARLQVELAQVAYVTPRLKRMWTHLGQQTGGGGGSAGGGYLRGAGERQIEIDKRLLQQRMDVLQQRIQEVRKVRKTQRVLREKTHIPVFAIVGYTNAGKSTLMHALTAADVLIEDKLFATLDTTTRQYRLPNKQEVLFIDTVGFIRKLPHLLVHAFRSTLEEAIYADFLLHVVDASHPNALEQAETTVQVLQELGASSKSMVTLLNKVDLVRELGPSAREVLVKLKLRYPRSIEISACTQEGFEALITELQYLLRMRRCVLHLRIPQKEYHLVSTLLQQGVINSQEYEGNDIVLEAEVPEDLSWIFAKYTQTN